MQALDLVTRALTSIGAYGAGEAVAPEDANDAFDMLNDMLQTWSNSTMMVNYVTEIIFTLVSNVYKYQIGDGGTVADDFTDEYAIYADITASIDGTTLTVDSVERGNVALGQYLRITGAEAPLENGTQIVKFISGAGRTGQYQVNIDQDCSSVTMKAYYERPLRINSAFVRSNNLDYMVKPLSIENYEQIGIKNLQGAWPRALYYQPSGPIGNITVWPVPGAGEMHMFAETVLQNFTSLAQVITLPQGYAMAIRWNLAELLMPTYGKNDPLMAQMIIKQAESSRAWVKRTNMQPVAAQTFDPNVLPYGPNYRVSSAWIYSGGFI